MSKISFMWRVSKSTLSRYSNCTEKKFNIQLCNELEIKKMYQKAFEYQALYSMIQFWLQANAHFNISTTPLWQWGSRQCFNYKCLITLIRH